MFFNAAMLAVTENGDLMRLVLAKLEPRSYVYASRVCKQWRDVCRDATLAIGSAKAAAWLTKRVMMGMLGLSSAEADALPRETHRRYGGGVMYVYPCDAVDEAWDRFVKSDAAWRARLEKRSQYVQSVERAFGPNWRENQWLSAKRLRAY